jgi:hypothetical protein
MFQQHLEGSKAEVEEVLNNHHILDLFEEYCETFFCGENIRFWKCLQSYKSDVKTMIAQLSSEEQEQQQKQQERPKQQQPSSNTHLLTTHTTSSPSFSSSSFSSFSSPSSLSSLGDQEIIIFNGTTTTIGGVVDWKRSKTNLDSLRRHLSYMRETFFEYMSPNELNVDEEVKTLILTRLQDMLGHELNELQQTGLNSRELLRFLKFFDSAEYSVRDLIVNHSFQGECCCCSSLPSYFHVSSCSSCSFCASYLPVFVLLVLLLVPRVLSFYTLQKLQSQFNQTHSHETSQRHAFLLHLQIHLHSNSSHFLLSLLPLHLFFFFFHTRRTREITQNKSDGIPFRSSRTLQFNSSSLRQSQS